MKIRLYFLGMFLLAFLPVNLLKAQTTVFSDDFNRSTLSPGGTPQMNYTTGSTATPAGNVTIGSGILSIYTNTAAGQTYVTGPLSSYLNSFTNMLTGNAGDVTWTFNMRTNRTTSLSGFGSSAYGVAVALTSTTSDLTTSNGYAVILVKGTTTNAIKLVKYTGGLSLSSNFTTLIGPSVDLALGTGTYKQMNYVSVKVIYSPSTDTWSLYFRDDAGTLVDPSTGDMTLVGTYDNKTDNTSFSNTVMTNFGYYYSHGGTSTPTSNKGLFYNFMVKENIPVVCVSGWPKVENANSSGFTVKVNTNVAGTSYYVVLSSGANAPSVAQIALGQDASGISAMSGSIACANGSTEYTSDVTSLLSNTMYDVYIVAKDGSGNNLQSTPQKVTFSTSLATSVSIPSTFKEAYVSHGHLVLFGGDVYDSTGMRVASITSNQETVLSLRQGIYIVKTSDTTQKVVIP